jgi:hypothetical protein
MAGTGGSEKMNPDRVSPEDLHFFPIRHYRKINGSH